MIFSERVRASRKTLGIKSLGPARVPRDGVEGYIQPVLSTWGRYCCCRRRGHERTVESQVSGEFLGRAAKGGSLASCRKEFKSEPQ